MGRLTLVESGVLMACFLVLTASACGGSSRGYLNDCPDHFAAKTFDKAKHVIGQPSFTAYMAQSGTDNGVNSPRGVGSGSLYVVDSGNHRILGFGAGPTTDYASADFVLGQASFATSGPGLSDSKFAWPAGLCSGGGKLCLADSVNHRVLIWNTLPTATNVPADVVVGQPDFVTNNSATTQAGLNMPLDVHMAGGSLFVADWDNNRVLIWNTVPTTDGAAADVVLGQANFATGTPNRGGPAGAGTLDLPQAVWSDGTRVVVADRGNNRVLIWDSIPTTNGQDADIVLGQSDFGNTAAAVGATRMSRPAGVCSNGTQLFVGDGGNNRVLIWDTFPTANQAAPDVVLGQSDFDHGAANDDDQDGVADGGPSDRTFEFAQMALRVHLYEDRLYVVDAGNNRVLIFDDA